MRTLLQDLALNLLSEAVGIAVTVFVVDYLIRRREEQRWTPSKAFVRAKLFRIADEFIQEYLGRVFRFDERGETHLYYFGGASIMSQGRLKDADIPLGEVETQLAIMQGSQKEFYYLPVENTHEKLVTLFDSSGALIEPEVSAMMLEFENQLTNILALKNRPNRNNTAILQINIYQAVLKAHTIRVYLEDKADKIQTFTEWEKENLFR